MGGQSIDFDYSSIKWEEKTLEERTYFDEISEGINRLKNVQRVKRRKMAEFQDANENLLHHPIILCGPRDKIKKEALWKELGFSEKRTIVYGPCGFEYIGNGPIPGYDP